MFWQEEQSVDQFQVPDDVGDLLFSIECRELPVDHAYALAAAIIGALPWVADDPRIGVHTVHVAGSQNGWERPAHDTGTHIMLSRRTKLAIRAPQERHRALEEGLSGLTLDVDGCPLRVGPAKMRPLRRQTTLFARYVAAPPEEDESGFLQRSVGELRALEVRVRKALCGKSLTLATPEGPLHTRSLMLADLSLEESLRLQQRGLGTHRHMGCGIFLPHKGIDALKKLDQE
jgi:CRISPR-associated protein Cas6